MKAADIMIGDYILCAKGVIKVEGLYNDGITEVVYTTGEYSKFSEDYNLFGCSPIPITKTWIKKIVKELDAGDFIIEYKNKQALVHYKGIIIKATSVNKLQHIIKALL